LDRSQDRGTPENNKNDGFQKFFSQIAEQEPECPYERIRMERGIKGGLSSYKSTGKSNNDFQSSVFSRNSADRNYVKTPNKTPRFNQDE
jgi:hypothetical protein